MAFIRRTADNIRSIPARAEIALRPAEQEFGPTERLSAQELRQLENFTTSEDVINALNPDNYKDGKNKIDATLLVLLQSIVEKQNLEEANKANLRDKLKMIQDIKIPVSAKDMEQGLEEFQTEAIKAYQRIASTTISIIEGEMSALTTGVPGAFSFDDDTAKEMRITETQMFGRPNVVSETNRFLEAYEQQIDDVLAALKFMVKEIDLTKQILDSARDDIEKIVDFDSPFQITAEVSNLIKATAEYLEILGETSFLENAIKDFTKAQSGLKGVIRKRPQSTAGRFTNMSDPESRAWGSNVIQGMATFAKFACRLSEAEGDLNKINQVDGAGVVRRGLGRAFNDIIVLDQKFYPMNNQIPIPPISVSPVVIHTYLEAYEERAVELITATENQLNQINNKFDRKIANAQRNLNQLSETLLMPKPAARSSISREQIVDVIETPEEFFARTAGIDLRDVPKDLERRRSRNRELATQYAVGLGAMPAARSRIAKQNEALEREAMAEAAAEASSNTLNRAGSRVMMANPRKKGRKKK